MYIVYILTHTGIYYIYVNLNVCVCVCVCVFKLSTQRFC